MTYGKYTAEIELFQNWANELRAVGESYGARVVQIERERDLADPFWKKARDFLDAEQGRAIAWAITWQVKADALKTTFALNNQDDAQHFHARECFK